MANNREKIIDAAMKLIKERDFDSVTVEDICAAAGIGRSTFYYYFKTKENIVSDFSKFSIIQSSNRIAFALSAPTCWERLLRMQTSYIVHIVKNYEPDLYLQYQKYCLNKRSKEELESETRMATLISPLIAQAQAAGEIRNSSEPSSLCEVTVALQRGLVLEWARSRGAFDLHDTLCRLMEAYYDVRPDLRGTRESLDYSVG